MLTQHYLSFFVKTNWGIIDLQCCNYYHLPSDSPSEFQSSMTIFHHKLLKREGRRLADGWSHPSSMTIFVHLFISKKALVATLNIMFSTVDTYEPYPIRFPLHLDRFVLTHTKIWWANGLHGSSPQAPTLATTSRIDVTTTLQLIRPSYQSHQLLQVWRVH